MGARVANASPEPRRTRPSGVEQGVSRWQLRPRKKGGAEVGWSKRGKGSRLMMVAEGNGLPIGLTIASASPHELNLAVPTLDTVRVPRQRGRPRKRPGELIADKAYDSRDFRLWLRRKGIKPTISVNRRGGKRRKPGRPIQVGPNYGERWKVERLFAWLSHYRRLLVRQDRYPSIYRAFAMVACILICLRQF